MIRICAFGSNFFSNAGFCASASGVDSCTFFFCQNTVEGLPSTIIRLNTSHLTKSVIYTNVLFTLDLFHLQ